MSEKERIEVVVFVNRCKFCSLYESCITLPDEEFINEATSKLFACIYAREMNAKFFENFSNFLDYIERRVGYSLHYFVITEVERNLDKEGFYISTKSMCVSPMIVVICEDEKVVGLVDLHLSKGLYSSVNRFMEYLEDVVRLVGAKRILDASYDECIRILKDVGILS